MPLPPSSRFLLPERSLGSRVELGSLLDQRWFEIKDAIGLIMRRRNIGPDMAELKLREACLSGKVKSRQITAIIDERGEKKIRIAVLPRDVWSSSSTIDVNTNTIVSCDLLRFEQVAVNELDLAAFLARPRRGPPTGKLARFADSDRSLFSAIDSITRRESKSVTEAVRDLDYEGKVKGRGTPEARVRRLVKLYHKERPGRAR
jgi:hypothetical protein